MRNVASVWIPVYPFLADNDAVRGRDRWAQRPPTLPPFFCSIAHPVQGLNFGWVSNRRARRAKSPPLGCWCQSEALQAGKGAADSRNISGDSDSPRCTANAFRPGGGFRAPTSPARRMGAPASALGKCRVFAHELR